MQNKKAVPLNLKAMRGIKVSYPVQNKKEEIKMKKGKKK